ncbi:hypothetical protein DL546_000893 [Coniochaeta pulveracea]|uniref:Ubiquitin-like protease family profile domain-containing protein n=1 Tax=Coniochaeta pulveracea TaxID=177199 RepID=A0A420XWL3_9PEZI|nr:hypothetical protein DL546_000893 [Coniochaeta pulveracea]
MGGTGSKRHGGRKAAPTGGVDVQKHKQQRDRILVNKPNGGKVTKRMGSGLTSTRNPHHKSTKGVRFMRSTRLMPKYGHQLSPGSAYLSYYDVLLTYEDIKALRNDWLTDNNISFWEEYLEREILPKYPQARIILLRPTMTFLMMRSQSVKDIASALPSFKGVTHIFLPINDNRDVQQAEGGSHWSLLLISTLDGVAFHYDSMRGSNYNEGKIASNRMSKILGIPLRYQQLDDCPQQSNGSDCGVFVCVMMRHLLVKRLLGHNAKEKVSMSMADKMIDAQGARKEMLRIIESFRKEGERRRSISPAASSSHTPPRIE